MLSSEKAVKLLVKMKNNLALILVLTRSIIWSCNIHFQYTCMLMRGTDAERPTREIEENKEDFSRACSRGRVHGLTSLCIII